MWVSACYKFWPLGRGVFVNITKCDLSQKRHFVLQLFMKKSVTVL